MAAQITAYFFLYPFVLSFRRAPSERGTMRCAFVQWSQFARRVRPPPFPFLSSRRADGPYKSRRSNKWFASQRPCAMQRCLLVRVHRCRRRLLLKSGDSAKINRFATRICEQGGWTHTGEGLTDPVHVRHLHRCHLPGHLIINWIVQIDNIIAKTLMFAF